MANEQTKKAKGVQTRRMSTREDLATIVPGEVVVVNGIPAMAYWNLAQRKELVVIYVEKTDLEKHAGSNDDHLCVMGLEFGYDALAIKSDGTLSGTNPIRYFNTFHSDESVSNLRSAGLLEVVA